MFTGIIEHTARIISVASKKPGMDVEIAKPAPWKLVGGQSICVDGACLTVIRATRRSFYVHCIPETLQKTIAAQYKRGTVVNLERSLKVDARLNGHLVSGHIDARGSIRAIQKDTKGVMLKVEIPASLRRYVVPKGSITINGVSLTVASAVKGNYSVALIPYTLNHTNLGRLKKGDEVNIEADLIARYVEGLRHS